MKKCLQFMQRLALVLALISIQVEAAGPQGGKEVSSQPKVQRIGILGGMGPAATADIYQKIIAATPAEKDQEHIPVVIWADPRVPDRPAALAGKGPSPVPALVEGVKKLEEAGASFVIVACNTAHAFFPEVRKQVSIPILNMMEETAEVVAARRPVIRKVGLLATAAAANAGVYQSAFKSKGIKVVTSDSASQEDVKWVIAQVKAGNRSTEVTTRLLKAATELQKAGAEAVILGCTELPLVLRDGQADLPIIDASEVLAQAAVSRAQGIATTQR
jgi:aspartate racemase